MRFPYTLVSTYLKARALSGLKQEMRYSWCLVNYKHSGTPEPYKREKGSGKTKCITLEAYVGSVHFLGREESEQF